jgi:uncharacterized protein YegP (UPF0339 family)
VTDSVVQLVKGRDGWFLRLVSANGQTLAVSESYWSKWNAKRAARKNFAGLRVVEVSR